MINFLLDPLIRAEELWGEELREFGLPGFAIPKCFGALPVSGHFGDFERVASKWLEGARLFRYRETCVRAGSSVILFSWVMPGGLGDWADQISAASILKMGIPDLKIELVTLVEESQPRFLRGHDFPNHIIIYRNNEPVHFSNTLLKKLSEASLILQIPTYYPHFQMLIDGIFKLSSGRIPVIASIGGSGSFHSEWFHPMSGNICMGIHPLERGLLLHTDASYVDAMETEPFYFAELESERGYAIYLHALLTSNKDKTNDLKLIVCNQLPLLSALKNQVFSDYGVKEITIEESAKKSVIKLSDSGKIHFIEVKQGLSTFSIQKLIVSAEDFVGCGNNHMLCEVITLEKFFFTDELNHPNLFLNDLKALATHYFPLDPKLATYIDYLSDKITTEKILGNLIGKIVSEDTLLTSMKKLIHLIKADFLFNPTLINYVKSKICEYYDPSLKEKEQLFFKEFLKGQHSLKELLCKKN